MEEYVKEIIYYLIEYKNKDEQLYKYLYNEAFNLIEEVVR